MLNKDLLTLNTLKQVFFFFNFPQNLNKFRVCLFGAQTFALIHTRSHCEDNHNRAESISNSNVFSRIDISIVEFRMESNRMEREEGRKSPTNIHKSKKRKKKD